MKPYWWFQGATVEKLTSDLQAAGADARLEVRLEGDHMTLQVVPAAGMTTNGPLYGPLDESHVCPPDCPS